MMKKFELNIDWDLFKAKFIGRETSKFEQMAYLLFASETGNPNGIFRYKTIPESKQNLLISTERPPDFRPNSLHLSLTAKMISSIH